MVNCYLLHSFVLLVLTFENKGSHKAEYDNNGPGSYASA